jgi:hypothetical protein
MTIRIGLKLLVLCASLGLTLSVFEVVLRLAGYQAIYEVYSKPSILWQEDPLLGWSHTPETSAVYKGPRPWPLEYSTDVEINALGLRGPVVEPLSEGGFRILVLGDSMVAAFEVPYRDTFIGRAEKKLNRIFDFEVQLINAGVRGYGTDQTYLYYTKRGHELYSDLVLFLPSTNDVRNNMTLHRMRRPFGKAAFGLGSTGELVLKGFPVPTYPSCSAYTMDAAYQPSRSDGITSRLFCLFETAGADHSALVTFATMTLRRNPTLMRWLYRFGNQEREFASRALELILPGVAHADSSKLDGAISVGGSQSVGGSLPVDDSSLVDDSLPVDDSLFAEDLVSKAAFRLTGVLVRSLARAVRDDGARFLMISGPGVLEDLGIPDIEEEGIHWRPLEIRRIFDWPLTFKNDGHWNPYGHRLIGDSVTLLLEEQIHLARPGLR